MNISTHITRLVKAGAAALALAAILVPAANAAGMTKDDWYRDASSVAIDQSRAVADTWYRDTNGTAIVQAPADDWYRNAPAVTAVALPTLDPGEAGTQPTPGGFDWGDFGIGAGSMVGALALLAMLAVGGRTLRRGRRILGRT